MRRRFLILMVVATLAGCGGSGKSELHGVPPTAHTPEVPPTSEAGTAGPTAPYLTSPPNTRRPPQPTRHPTPTPPVTTTTSHSPTPSPVTTTATFPKIVSWKILYHDHEFVDFFINDHGVPPCTQTLWQLKMVLSPGDIPFRLYIELDGQVVYDQQVAEGLPDPSVSYFPVQRDGPHDISAGVHLRYGDKRDNRYVHFACRAA